MVGTLIYIANHLPHKYRDDVNIYKNIELESTFIETVSEKIKYYCGSHLQSSVKGNSKIKLLHRNIIMKTDDMLNNLDCNISISEKENYLLLFTHLRVLLF